MKSAIMNMISHYTISFPLFCWIIFSCLFVYWGTDEYFQLIFLFYIYPQISLATNVCAVCNAFSQQTTIVEQRAFAECRRNTSKRERSSNALLAAAKDVLPVIYDVSSFLNQQNNEVNVIKRRSLVLYFVLPTSSNCINVDYFKKKALILNKSLWVKG